MDGCIHSAWLTIRECVRVQTMRSEAKRKAQAAKEAEAQGETKAAQSSEKAAYALEDRVESMVARLERDLTIVEETIGAKLHLLDADDDGVSQIFHFLLSTFCQIFRFLLCSFCQIFHSQLCMICQIFCFHLCTFSISDFFAV